MRKVASGAPRNLPHDSARPRPTSGVSRPALAPCPVPASQALEEGLSRFPDSFRLHDPLRGGLLEAGGARELVAESMRRFAEADAPLDRPWFAGYASSVAAEFHRREHRPGEARAAYARALRHDERAIQDDPASRASADH